MSSVTYVFPIFRPTISVVPPVNCLGHFHGCPSPGLSVFRYPAPIVVRINKRLYITPYIVPRPWYVLPMRRIDNYFYNYRR